MIYYGIKFHCTLLQLHAIARVVTRKRPIYFIFSGEFGTFYFQINMAQSLPSADYSGKLSIGRSCLCFTRWSRPCQARFLMSKSPPVLQIEKRGGKVKQVSLVDAALCPQQKTSCSSDANQKIVIKLSGGKKLFLKAASAEEREEWRVRLEAAMLLPLLEGKGISAASLSAAVVEEEKEEANVEAKVFHYHGETLKEPDRLPVEPPKEKGKVANKEERQGKGGEPAKQEERQGKGGEPAKPQDACALSKAHTTCQWQFCQFRSTLGSEGAENASEAALPSMNMPRNFNEEGDPSKTDAGSLSGAPSWMGLIRRSEVLEPDMMDFDYEEMFKEASQCDENIVPRRSALINSILKQLVQTMNPSKVPVYVNCI